MTADPFTVLGLPVRPDLTDDDVRSAWRRIAAATHPDRADGGDPDGYAVASAAYTELQTPSGRGEAYADVAAGSRWRPGLRGRAAAPRPRAGAAEGNSRAARGSTPPRAGARATGSRGLRGHARPAAALASRIRRGRPGLLTLRCAITAGVCGAAFGVVGGQPAAAGLAAGAVTWLLLTGRHDIMPPGNE